MITTIYSDPDFLEHHGIKGMRWGVRRYQNYDGSLKSAGKAHLAANASAKPSWKERREAVKQKQLEADKKAKQEKQIKEYAKGGWTRSYNAATDELNSRIGAINDKYEDYEFTTDSEDRYNTIEGYNYINEINTLWQKKYREAIINEYGPELGEQFVEAAPFMDNYLPEYWVNPDTIAKANKNRR